MLLHCTSQTMHTCTYMCYILYYVAVQVHTYKSCYCTPYGVYLPVIPEVGVNTVSGIYSTKPQSGKVDIFHLARPISNLPFLSKVIEKVIAAQLTSYVEDNNLCELFQSAYRRNHSTETVLIRVHNDIAMTIDKGHSAILVLLDLSAAFDTVDHSMLLSRLNTRFGICDKALNWFQSYLSGCTQFVKVNNGISVSHSISHGVPQGSVLGPILYSLYASPLGDIAKAHGLNIRFYADDTQLYVTFKTSCPYDMESAQLKIEACIRDIELWMLINKLKMNNGKTDVPVFSSRYRHKPSLFPVSVCDKTVECSPTVKNIGVLFDDSLSLVPHVTATCKSAFYHLRNIYKIRFLTPDTTESIVHAFVTSRIDYCKSLLYGLPKCVLKNLQYVQNSAARLIYLSRKFDHVTPLLITLHWLPIEQRIHLKVLLITYKALNGKALQSRQKSPLCKSETPLQSFLQPENLWCPLFLLCWSTAMELHTI